MNTLLRRAVAQTVTEAYDRTDEALREVERIAPELSAAVEKARDLLFQVRLDLEHNG